MIVTLPANASGDNLLVYLLNAAGGPAATPSGWVARITQLDGAGNINCQVFTIASAGGMGTVTVANNTQGSWRAFALNTGSRVYQTASSTSNASATTITAPSLTSAAGSVLYDMYWSGSGATPTAPAGQIAVNSSYATLGCEVGGAGPTGTRTATFSSNSWNGAIALLVG